MQKTLEKRSDRNPANSRTLDCDPEDKGILCFFTCYISI